MPSVPSDSDCRCSRLSTGLEEFEDYFLNMRGALYAAVSMRNFSEQQHRYLTVQMETEALVPAAWRPLLLSLSVVSRQCQCPAQARHACLPACHATSHPWPFLVKTTAESKAIHHPSIASPNPSRPAIRSTDVVNGLFCPEYLPPPGHVSSLCPCHVLCIYVCKSSL